MLSRVTAKNVGDVFLRHTVESRKNNAQKTSHCTRSIERESSRAGSENPLSDSDKIWHRVRGARPHHPYKIWWPSVWGFRGQWGIKRHPFLL